MDSRGFEKEIREAVSLVDNVGYDVVYLRETSGLLRLVKSRQSGKIFVVGAGNSTYLQEMAKAIAEAIGAEVGF